VDAQRGGADNCAFVSVVGRAGHAAQTGCPGDLVILFLSFSLSLSSLSFSFLFLSSSPPPPQFFVVFFFLSSPNLLPFCLIRFWQAKLQKEYGAFLVAPESGYDVTLKLDTGKLTPEQKTRIPFHFAMLKRNIFAAPFADFFDACQAKKDLPTLEVKYRAGGESVFLKTEQDRCIVIFNVRFVDKDDQLLGKVFIEEFVHARKALAAAPSCSFSLVEPPRELEGIKVGETEGHFLVFSLNLLFQRVWQATSVRALCRLFCILLIRQREQTPSATFRFFETTFTTTSSAPR
jgi:hypothetical protein